MVALGFSSIINEGECDAGGEIVDAQGSRGASSQARAGTDYRKISAATGASKRQAADYVRRAALAGITWPVPEGIDDAGLEHRLFPIADAGASMRPAIDWPAIQR